MTDDRLQPEEALEMVYRAQRNYLEARRLRSDVIRLAVEHGCSYRQIAEAMSLSPGTVHNLANGRAR